MKALLVIAAITWTSLWFTPDQLGQRQFQRGEYEQAARAFRDPMWQGVAWYRAGEFEKAAQAFARRSTPEAYFNQGNARLMRGEYGAAIACYDRALALRPHWREAGENRALAEARAGFIHRKGGNEGGDQGEEEGRPDEISFNKAAKNGGEEVEMSGDESMSEQAIQALWLRRVQTRPADFLKAKFSYQQTVEQEGGR